MSDTRAPFTVAEGLKMQRQHLAEWATKLNAETYIKLIDAVMEENVKVSQTAKSGYDICRGTSILNIICNL